LLNTDLGVEHDLGCPVPTGGHVLREEPGVVVVRVSHAGQTKVADLRGLRERREMVNEDTRKDLNYLQETTFWDLGKIKWNRCVLF